MTQRKNGYFFEIIKGLIIAILLSLLLVVIAAFAIKLFSLSDDMIPIINQIIKGISIFVAALISLKLPGNGWLRGAILGIFYILLSFVVFSLLSGSFEIGLEVLNDAAIGLVCGIISGISAVNIIRHA